MRNKKKTWSRKPKPFKPEDVDCILHMRNVEKKSFAQIGKALVPTRDRETVRRKYYETNGKVRTIVSLDAKPSQVIPELERITKPSLWQKIRNRIGI